MTARRNLSIDFDNEHEEQEKKEALEFAKNALDMTTEEYKNYVSEYCGENNEKIKNFNELLINRYKYYKFNDRLDDFGFAVKMRYEGFLKQKKASKREESEKDGKGTQKRKTKGKTKRTQNNTKK